MKRPRISRITLLAGTAGLMLLALIGFDDNDEAAAQHSAERPRAAARATATATAATATAPASAVALRGADWLGAAAQAAPTAAAPSAPSASHAARAETVPPRDRASALAALDTTLLAQRVPPGAGASDAFAPKSWFVAPPAPPPVPEAPPPPPPPPQAPPLPFKYMGSMQETPERTVWYLLHGERLIVAGAGDVVQASYRIEGAKDGQLHMTYLPLNQRQTLLIGVQP